MRKYFQGVQRRSHNNRWFKRISLIWMSVLIVVAFLGLALLTQSPSAFYAIFPSTGNRKPVSSPVPVEVTKFLKKEGDVCELIGLAIGRETREIVFIGDSSALRSFKSNVDLSIQCGESFVKNASAAPKLLRGVVRVSNNSLAAFASWALLKKAKDVRGTLSAEVWNLAARKTKKGPLQEKPLLKLTYVPALYASDVTNRIRTMLRNDTSIGMSVATNFVLMFGMWDVLRPREDLHRYSFSSATVSPDNATKMQWLLSRYMLRTVLPDLEAVFQEWCSSTVMRSGAGKVKKYLPTSCNPFVVSDLISPNCSAPKFNSVRVRGSSPIADGGSSANGFDYSEAKKKRTILPKLFLGGKKKMNGRSSDVLTVAPEVFFGPDPYQYLQEKTCKSTVREYLVPLYSRLLGRLRMSSPTNGGDDSGDGSGSHLQPIAMAAPRIPKDCKIPDGVHPDLGPVTGDRRKLTSGSRRCRKAQSLELWRGIKQSIDRARAERCRMTSHKKYCGGSSSKK